MTVYQLYTNENSLNHPSPQNQVGCSGGQHHAPTASTPGKRPPRLGAAPHPFWKFWWTEMSLEICALLRYYAASGGNSLPMLIVCPETSVRNYHCTLRNIPEDSLSYLLQSGSLISSTEISLIPVWKRTSDPYHIQYRDYAPPKNIRFT
jgi:hypothetical protein